MIITILVNVVFVVSLIMLSFYFVTANIYDMTLMPIEVSYIIAFVIFEYLACKLSKNSKKTPSD